MIRMLDERRDDFELALRSFMYGKEVDFVERCLAQDKAELEELKKTCNQMDDYAAQVRERFKSENKEEKVIIEV